MKKLMLLMMFSILFIGVVSAESIGTFKIGKEVTLPQLCATCTYNNITNILYPNGSIILSNQTMTKDGSYYNYTLSSTYTGTAGTYVVNGIGDLDGTNTIWSYTFQITDTGSVFDTPKSIVYGMLMFILVIMIIGGFIATKKLPDSNEQDNEGRILSVNKLKYLRYPAYFVLYVLILSLVFLASNVAYAYLGEQLFYLLLFNLFRIGAGLLPLILLLWVVKFFVVFFEDKKTQQMIGRGLFPRDKKWKGNY